jgi:predicted RNA methylase
MTEGAFNCLLDQSRTRAFKRAIKRTVRRGDVVADLGAGTGILSMIAAGAGARKIYAVESDLRNVRTLQHTFASNNFDQIEVLTADATKCHLPEKVDVVICEMVATALIEELQVPAMNNVHRYLRKGGRVVLRRIRNFVEIVYSPERFHGFRFPIVRYEYIDVPELRGGLLTGKHLIGTVDFAHLIESDTVRFSKNVGVTRTGRANALRISSESEFWDGSRLGASYAYSYPIVLPLDKSVHLIRGQTIHVDLRYRLCGGFSSLTWGVKT